MGERCIDARVAGGGDGVPLLRGGRESGIARGIERRLPPIPRRFIIAIVRFGIGALVGTFCAGGRCLDGTVARGIGKAGGGGGIVALEQRVERFVEAGGASAGGGRSAGGAGIEAANMGEQQPRIEAPPFAHSLAPEPDGFASAVDRAVCQHLFGLFARIDQRG
ncbi:MAG: hypothetical protein C0409_11280, partial [Novosphingobium sp.]|nr:hypothetical protein [Novosphingobium sp.]